MKLTGVELRRLTIPLRAPFRTSFGSQHERDVLLLRLVTSEAEGWAECVAMREPVYSSEYVDGAAHVIENFLLPALSAHEVSSPADVAPAMSAFRGHVMAKAAVETAVLDAWLRGRDTSLRDHLGGTRKRIPSGVSVGIAGSVGELLDEVAGFIDQGYLRIKLKIEPGWDVIPVAAVRERFGEDLLLQVDANAAYELGDASHLARLDAFGLLLLEQPLAEDDLHGHARLARQLSTPICLDESITSARGAAYAISIGATQVVNIKPGRVGGYLEAVRIHDVCVAHNVPVWCGGMLETGIGRAANVALASLPGFTLPGDTSASDRFYERDVTEPFRLVDGNIDVPTGPGTGVTILPDVLDELTTSRQWIDLQ